MTPPSPDPLQPLRTHDGRREDRRDPPPPRGPRRGHLHRRRRQTGLRQQVPVHRRTPGQHPSQPRDHRHRIHPPQVGGGRPRSRIRRHGAGRDGQAHHQARPRHESRHLRRRRARQAPRAPDRRRPRRFHPQHDGLTPQSLLRYKGKDCTCSHDLYVAEGRVCKRHITDDGKTHYTPLPVEELECREGKNTRFYHRITVDCPEKTHTFRIRVDETDEDRQIDPKTGRQRFNRTEHLRQVPPGTPAARRLKGFRRDNESIHSRFDQAYPHERVPAYGAWGALLIYIGYAWVGNSITRTLNAIHS